MNTQTIKRLGSAFFCVLIAAGCPRKSGAPLPTSVNRDDPKAASRDARAEAQRDIQNGRFVVKTYGLPQPWAAVYRNSLMSKYQIELRSVGDCVLTEPIMRSVSAYNDVSQPEIERRYGAGFLERVEKEARESFQNGGDGK